MRLTKFLGFKKCKGSRQVPPVPPPSVPDFRGREMLHQVQAQRLKPNCMAVGNYFKNIGHVQYPCLFT